MTIPFWQLGWRSLWRDARAGELRLLLVAVTLAVAALSAVGFFADRIKGGMQRDAKQLLGGDVVVVSDRPTPALFTERAQALGLSMSTSLGFPTMARATADLGGSSRLVALKAVQAGYPLRGQLLVRDAPDAPARPTRDIPNPGEAWVDNAVLEALGLKVGDALLLGDTRLRIQRVIDTEPDRGAGFINFAPRVLIHQNDLAATALVQPASRISWRLALAGDDAQVASFTQWATNELKQSERRGMRVESMQTGRPEMAQTTERADKFLNLVALLAALLSAVAVALSARSFASSHLDDCAMLRVLGLSQRTIAASYALEFALVGLLASVLGVLLGYAVHHVFVQLMAGVLDTVLPAPGVGPVLLGLGVGFTLMLAFGLPPVLQLAQVPALRVIRRDVGQLRPASWAVLVLGVLGFSALLLAASSDVQMGLITVGGFAGATAVFALASWLAVGGLRRLVNESTAPRWLVLATRQVCARPAYTVVQISSLAVGLLALVLLVLLRTDLIASWQQATPADAPNRFVINIQPDQNDAFQKTLHDAGVTRYDWFPMFRGRLVAINERSVSAKDYDDAAAARMVDREFNLSHSDTVPAHNEISAGRWTPQAPGEISVEEGIAKTLGLKLGDQLRFDIAGTVVNAKITSLRKVDWSSMRANFFVLYPLKAMPEMPVTYLSAFKVPTQKGFDNTLVRQFPNVTVVDLSSTLAQVQRVLDQVIRAVEFLFGFTLAAGLVVLFAAVTATRQERAREFAIMRAVGASGKLLRQVQGAELLGVGLLAGSLASIVASIVGWALAHYVFNFTWVVSVWIPLLGVGAGAVLALAAGWWGLRDVLTRPVMDTLRRSPT
jgi:putative ABC transport system permease protein